MTPHTFGIFGVSLLIGTLWGKYTEMRHWQKATCETLVVHAPEIAESRGCPFIAK